MAARVPTTANRGSPSPSSPVHAAFHDLHERAVTRGCVCACACACSCFFVCATRRAELAALFALDEEDCYIYCLKKRADSTQQDLVALKHKKTANVFGSYALVTAGLWFGLQNNVLGNVWFMSKTWPFFAVFYMLASHFQKSITAFKQALDTTESEVAAKNKCEGETAVYLQMKRYAGDARCLEYLTSFQGDVSSQLADFRWALLQQHKDELVARMQKQLLGLQQAEHACHGIFQSVLGTEVVAAFEKKYAGSAEMYEASVDAAIEGLKGGDVQHVDPISVFARATLKELEQLDLCPGHAATTSQSGGGAASGSATSHIVERVLAAWRAKERELMDGFTVRPEEARDVQELAEKCRTAKDGLASSGSFDVNKLSEAEQERLWVLYDTINKKVGFFLSRTSTVAPVREEPSAREFTGYVNEELKRVEKRISTARLESFLRSFYDAPLRAHS
eukprot:GHVU01053428.1.p1 GENE.GHVU01053428.1~~GHVU01053428.1.p1  ORF type:complete len:450 (-),score=83.12 GHVU01053428.1:433-1782(-)